MVRYKKAKLILRHRNGELVRDTHPTTSPILIRRSLCPALTRLEFRVYAGPNSPNSLQVPQGYGQGAGYAGRLSHPPEGGTPNSLIHFLHTKSGW